MRTLLTLIEEPDHVCWRYRGAAFAPALEIVRHALGRDADRAILRAETVGPEQALATGMVQEVVAAEELLPRAMDLATELAARSPEAYRLAKTQLHGPANAAMEGTSAEDDAAVLEGWISEDTRRRIEAALEALTRR